MISGSSKARLGYLCPVDGLRQPRPPCRGNCPGRRPQAPACFKYIYIYFIQNSAQNAFRKDSPTDRDTGRLWSLNLKTILKRVHGFIISRHFSIQNAPPSRRPWGPRPTSPYNQQPQENATCIDIWGRNLEIIRNSWNFKFKSLTHRFHAKRQLATRQHLSSMAKFPIYCRLFIHIVITCHYILLVFCLYSLGFAPRKSPMDEVCWRMF